MENDMAHLTEIFADTRPAKTYSNKANMERAIAKATEGSDHQYRYLTMRDEDGRVWPVFIGHTQYEINLTFQGFSVTG